MIRRAVGYFVLMIVAGIGLSSAADATTAQRSYTNVLLVTVDHAGFRDVFGGDDRALALASLGGAGLVSQRLTLGTTIQDVFGPWSRPFGQMDGGSVAGAGGGVDPAKLGAVFDRLEVALRPMHASDVVVMFVSRSPSYADVRAGDELGVIAMATGTGKQIEQALHSSPAATRVPALSSDSTRRDGAVTTSDIAVTIANLTQTPVPSSVTGAVIHPTDAPAPFDLYQRYRDQRRLTVPIGVAAGIYVTVAGLFALVMGFKGSRISERLRMAAAWTAISIVPLGLALLEVGRFPRLTYAVVIPFLIGVTVLGTTATVMLARRRGAVRALVWLALAAFVALAIEAAMGWPGAVTPLLGGSQLDGGRFFGLPNAFIGLVLGSAVFVALGLRRTWAGMILLFSAGLVVGSPWFGSDLGGAITLCAVAGIWWGARSRARLVRTALVAGATALGGAVLVVLTQRYLASSPTHITHFAEGSGHAGGIVGTVEERLRIGVKLLVTHPFAVLPVVGVPVALWAVLRPGPGLRPVLQREPAFTAALITILLGSVVAYAVNDTGASALGLGFASAVAAMLFVLLMVRREAPIPA
jgi:hypothetical protein